MTIKVDGTNGVLQAYDYQVLTTGFSYTFATGVQTLVINPAGTLATGTITMPASPVDGMVITFSTTQQITALTVNGNTGQSITSGPTFMNAGSSASYVYNLANTAWRPMSNVPLLAAQPLGYGQTLQDLSTSRAFSTTYTNTTGRPIQIQITWASNVQYTVLNFTLNADLINVNRNPNPSGTNYYYTLSTVIPDGITYAASGGTLNTWYEVR